MTNATLKGSTLVLPSQIDKATVANLAKEVLALAGKRPLSAVDLSKVEVIDAAGLEFLASAKKTFSGAIFSKPSQAIRNLTGHLGASGLLEGAS